MDEPLPTPAPAAPDAPAVDATAAPDAPAADATTPESDEQASARLAADPAPAADPDATLPGALPAAAMQSGPLEDEHGPIASEPVPAPAPQPVAAPVIEHRSFGRPSAEAPMVITNR